MTSNKVYIIPRKFFYLIGDEECFDYFASNDLYFACTDYAAPWLLDITYDVYVDISESDKRDTADIILQDYND